MDELQEGLNLSITGPLADQALGRMHRTLGEWGLAMPAVEPLVLDFGLGDFWNTGLIEYWIANEAAAGYCGKFLFVFDGQTCPRHRHREKLETFLVVRGRVRMDYEGAVSEMAAGAVLRAEPGHDHRFTGLGPALLLEVSTPCRIADNEFADPAIPVGSNFRGTAR